MNTVKTIFVAVAVVIGSHQAPVAAGTPEPANTGWVFYIDNDLLVPGGRDRDYTGGFSLTRSGASLRDNAISIEPMRARLDNALGVNAVYSGISNFRHSQEIGITTFTPQNLEDTDAQVGDRPYASLVHMSQSRAAIDEKREVAYLSTLTIGLLGLDLVGNLQSGLHKVLGSTRPEGWHNQISDGGEPTFRYSLARTGRVWKKFFGAMRGESVTAMRVSAGYLTQMTLGVATRFGEIRSPWWSYNPQLADYAEKTVPVAAVNGRNEQYLWAGFSAHVRAYNVFLQGQFRDSNVTFSAGELRPVVAEAWLGYTFACEGGWRYSYVVRAMSSEIREGPGDRSFVWGGLTISQAF